MRSKPEEVNVDAQTAARALEPEESVAAAYLYGSRATGLARPDSDFDLAVVWQGAPGDLLELRERLCQRLDTEHVDLVSLETAPAPLASRILTEGVLVWDRSPHRRADVLERVFRKMQDYLPVWDRFLRESTLALREDLGDR